MEQFTLEKYLQDPTRKVVTRDGREVRILCTDKRGNALPIVSLVNDGDAERLLQHFDNGTTPYKGDERNDLFFAPYNKSAWVFLYKSGTNQIVSFTCKDKSYAESKMKEYNGFALTEITWEE